MPEMKTLTVGGYTFTIVDAESVKYVPQDPTAAEQEQAQNNLNVKNITVMVSAIEGGNRLIFVDANGTHPVDIMDGVSPVVTLERTASGVLISVTDKNGTTTAEVKDGKDGEGGSGGNVDLTGYATEQYVQEYAQPKGDYLTEHQSLDGYAKTKDIPTKPEDIGAQPVGNYLTEVPSGYATEKWVREGYQPKGNYLTEVPEGYAKTTDIPTKPGDIGAQPAGNYALKSEIPSVPVQSVNGKTGAVKLSASDVGARPSDWTPTAQEVGALPSTYTPPNQTAEQVGADPKGTAATAVSQHNTAGDAHGDIRLALQAINDRLTAFFDSDDQTLDELSEIVAYITSNKSLIDAITTSKVSVLDIVNNLTTNVANKPLSAAQGVALKALIDAITIPTKLSQLANDKGYITGYTETDPTVPSWAKAESKPSYTKSEVGLGNVENVKQYSDSNPPPYPVTSVNGKTGVVTVDVPTVPTNVSAFTNDAGYLTQGDKGIYYIEGTGDTAGTWLGSHADIKAYTPGLTVLYKVPVAGASPTTLNINNLGAVTVVRNVSTAISTSYAVNCVIMLTYTVDSGTAYFKIADYDANTKTSAGTSNKTGTKMFLVGAASQTSSGTTTYSNTNCYIGTNNRLYSGGEVVPNTDDVKSLITKEAIEEALGYTPMGVGTFTPLTGKKIVYDGDSICAAAFSYPKLIADKTACIYDNQAVGGARLCSYSGKHSVVDNLPNLPTDGDIYCFQGGINDWWGNTPVGTYTQGDYTGTVDPTTIYGAMETICRYALTNFFGKAICFVITHKVQNAAYSKNTAGNTFWDYRTAMINVCEKYSIPYYDAFTKSGLNGWHTDQKAGLFVSGDGTHPNETAYEAYYVPQLISLFESIVPVGDYEAPAKPVTYTNVLKNAVGSDGQPYNSGKGWKEDTYLNGSGVEQSSTNYDVTGFIPINLGDIVRIKNAQLCKTVNSNTKCQIQYYKSDFSLVTVSNYLKSPADLSSAWNVVTNDAGTDIVQFTFPTSLSGTIKYIRICFGSLTDASIITVNEEID